MPPRKKTVKKTTPAPKPVRRPATRRSIASAAAASATTAEDPAIIPEAEVDTPVAGAPEEGTVPVDTQVSGGEEKEKGDSFLETAVVGGEEKEKDGGSFAGTPVATTEEKEKDASVVDTPKVADEEVEKAATFVETPMVGVEEKEKDAVFAGTPVVACERKENDTTFVETPVVGVVEKEKDADFAGTPVVACERKENDAPFVETPVVGVEEKEKDAVFAGTPVVACGVKEKDIPLIETPVSVDQKSEAAAFGSPEAQTPAPLQDVAMEEPAETSAGLDEGADAVGSGGKPEGAKKVVRIVKKVTRRVVVKKKPKVVKKEEEKSEDAVAMDGGVRIEDKECKPTSSSDAVVVEGGVGIEEDKECKPTSSSDAVMVEGGLGIEEDKERKLTSTLNVDVEETNIGSDGIPDQIAEAMNCESESAAPAASSGEALMEQELKTDVEELPVAENGHVGKMVFEEKDKGEEAPSDACVGDEEAALSERQRRRKTEIFIGGLDRDAKEEDIRKVFGKIGEIVEVRLLMEGKTGKNKGYAFLRYTTAALAKQAVSDFAKVEVCGKLCGAAALEGNDTILLGNIDKKWKKEDLMRLLEEIGIEKIDTVTVVSDPNNADANRGFAFLELQTNKDAQIAFKKLQKKDAFGKGLNIKISWSTPPNEPDEDDMLKVKSVFIESVPSSWEEEKVRECFKKFGEIERVVLARNIPASKKKDYAFVNYTTREAALSCIESFDKEEFSESGSKVNIRVSLAKPSQKSKGVSKFGNKDMPRDRLKAVQRDPRENTFSKAKPFTVGYGSSAGDKLLFREQTAWKQGHMAYNRGPPVQNYPFVLHGEKRPYSSLGGPAFHPDPRGYPRARMDGPFPAASPSTMPNSIAGLPPHYQQQNVGYGTGAFYGATDPSSGFQARYGNAPPYGSNRYPRY